MSLLEHPTAQALLADAEVSAAAVAGCRRRLDPFLRRYLPRFYRVEQHELARGGPAGQAQRPAAQDLRTHRLPGRPPPQARPALRRRRPLGRRGRHGRAAPPRGRGAGRPRRRAGPGPQRLPQVGRRLLRRGPPVVRPAGQGRELPGRRLPGLRHGRGLRPGGPATVPARGLGRATPSGGRPPTCRRGRLPGELADRPGPARPCRGRTCRPAGWPATTSSAGLGVPGGRCGAAAARYVLDVPCNTLIRDLGEAPAARRGPPWRRVDEWAKAQPRRWRKVRLGRGVAGAEGGAGGGGVGADQGRGRPGRPARAAGGHPHASTEGAAGLVHAVQRAGDGAAGQVVGSTAGGTGSKSCSRPAKGRWGWGSTRCGVGWAGTTT